MITVVIVLFNHDLGPDQTEAHRTAFLVEEYNLKKQQLDTFFFEIVNLL